MIEAIAWLLMAALLVYMVRLLWEADRHICDVEDVLGDAITEHHVDSEIRWFLRFLEDQGCCTIERGEPSGSWLLTWQPRDKSELFIGSEGSDPISVMSGAAIGLGCYEETQ